MDLDLIFNGQIHIDEYGILCINNVKLCDKVDSMFSVGDKLQIVYYITDGKVYDLMDIIRAQINYQMGIVEKLDFELDAYSEMTILELKEDFVIGGHNVIDELIEFEGKYVFMIIKYIDEV